MCVMSHISELNGTETNLYCEQRVAAEDIFVYQFNGAVGAVILLKGPT
jgi:hypothetical protein